MGKPDPSNNTLHIGSPLQDKQHVFTISDISRITNFSRRQIDYWANTGVLKASFHDVRSSDGKRSAYFTRGEVLKALIFCDMKARGFTVQQIRRVSSNLTALSEDLEKSGAFILSDGHSVFLAKSGEQAIDILRHERQMLLVPIEDQLRKLGQG